MPTLTKLYSMEEAALHSTPDDCWVVIDGKTHAKLMNALQIYDVTKYLEDHPGGADDDTGEFYDAGHSKSAKELMQDYFIGELDTTPDIPDMEVCWMEQDFIIKLVANAMQSWVIPALVVGISVVVAILYARRK